MSLEQSPMADGEARLEPVPASSTEAVVLTRYLELAETDYRLPGSGISRALGRIIPRAMRPLARRAFTEAISRQQRQVARKIAASGPVRLHLGCGEWPKRGWVNVDLAGLPVDLAWDLAKPLPFESSSAEAIFHEHVLEHLTLAQGFAFMKECRRVIQPGGIVRVGVPDAERYVRSYADPSSDFLATVRPTRPTRLLALQEEFYSHGHRTMYDFETLSLVCRAAGFTSVERRSWGQGALRPVPDSEHRKDDTLYVELTG